MDHRIVTLFKALENNGWSFVGPADVKSDWWFKDIFLFVSKWRPVGAKLYLTLLIDPAENAYKKVWAVGFSNEIPQDRNFAFLKHFTINDLGKTNMPALVKELNRM